MTFRRLCEPLAGLENLATIWAVHRSEQRLREQTLKHHAMLQASGRETHFMVVPDPAKSLAQQLADSRDPLDARRAGCSIPCTAARP